MNFRCAKINSVHQNISEIEIPRVQQYLLTENFSHCRWICWKPKISSDQFDSFRFAFSLFKEFNQQILTTITRFWGKKLTFRAIAIICNHDIYTKPWPLSWIWLWNCTIWIYFCMWSRISELITVLERHVTGVLRFSVWKPIAKLIWFYNWFGTIQSNVVTPLRAYNCASIIQALGRLFMKKIAIQDNWTENVCWSLNMFNVLSYKVVYILYFRLKRFVVISLLNPCSEIQFQSW